MKSLFAAITLSWVSVSAAAQDIPVQNAPSTSITIGRTHMVSYAPDDVRHINIYLPEGYDTGTGRYPVLYLINGGLDQDFLHIAGTSALNSVWGRSRPVIVVGIETKTGEPN